MGALEDLLTVQDHDTAMAQLRHRRDHLPEQEQLKLCLARLGKLDADLAPTMALDASLSEQQRVLETSIHGIDGKISAAEKQLYSGAVSATRELQALEADIASLKRHRNDLEDQELAVLVAREPVDAALADAARARALLRVDEAAHRAAIDAAAVEIDDQLVTHAAGREAQAANLDASLLAAYESTKTANRGIGAARLDHGTCMACRMKLSAVYLDTIRKSPPDSVVRCEECSAILVR